MPEGCHELHESRDTCDQEPRAQPATPVDGVPTTTTADVEPRHDFAELY